MKLLDGKLVSEFFIEQYKKEVEILTAKGLRKPHLAAILVGENVASQTYVNNKVRTCKQIGYDSTLLNFDANISEQELLESIEKLNTNETIDGILVQLPLPKHISESKVILSINPNKDVDGFHPINIGKMVIGESSFVSATPWGILMLLDYYKIDTMGMNCVVIGRSNIVGTPISILLSRNSIPGNASVTLCHSKTKDLKSIVSKADLIIAAIGIPEFVTRDMIKPGAIIVDVGINRKTDLSKKLGYRLVGDVNFEEVAPVCEYITPVPKGVGPMTICALMQNTLQAYKNKET